MKKPDFWGVLGALATLVSVAVVMFTYREKVCKAVSEYLDELQAKRSNLRIFMD